MFYKPKFCCNCSEKIERNDWSWRSSSRFCRLCETNFFPQIWIPRAIVVIGVVGIIFGFTGYFQKNEKPLKILSSNISGNSSYSKKDLPEQSSTVQVEAKSSVQTAPKQASTLIEQRQKQSAPATQAFVQKTHLEPAENHTNSDERVYFCGAMTKKGTPCSRRVKGGGRCWQHAGQPAILSPEQLIASR